MTDVKYDVLVVGGGPAGVSAAVSARKLGAQVLILEKAGFLGGTMTQGMVGALCGMFSARRSAEDTVRQIVQGTGEEIRRTLEAMGGVSGQNTNGYFDSYAYDPPLLQIALDQLIKNYGVEVRFHTLVCGVSVESRGIREVKAVSKSGFKSFEASVVIDASGDADIVWLAGGACIKNTDELQPGSMNFRVCNVDPSYPTPKLPEVASAVREELERNKDCGLVRIDSMFVSPVNRSEVICGFSRITVDGTDVQSLTRAEFEGREQVLHTLKFIRKAFPAFRDARICSIASVGIRETRRIEGESVLTDDAVYYGRSCLDSIGRSAWPIERHVAGERHTVVAPLKEHDSYDIPFSSMIPKKFCNLIVAGRSISSERAANASVRVFGPCTVMGDAAGTAAALMVGGHVHDVREISAAEIRNSLAGK